MNEITSYSCRVCFSRCKSSDINLATIAKMFHNLTGFQINSLDVPKKMCSSCHRTLKQFHRFKMACLEAEKILEANRLKVPKIEKISLENNQIETQQVLNVGIRKLKEKKSKKEKIPQSRVICEQCGKDILKSRLADHIGAKHNAKRFECDICGSSYVEKANLIRHMFYKHLKNQRQYPCPYCDKIYEQSGSRSLHIKKIHTNDLRHVCNICGKRFVKPSKLKYHMAIHSDVRNVPCPQCDSMFRSIKDLMGHRSAVHSNRTYICQICNETFKNSRLLKTHRVIHT